MGPLEGITVIEVASMAPGQFCGMMLADLGADVIRVDRMPVSDGRGFESVPPEFLLRGRRSIAIDLKHPDGPGVLLRLVERADVLLEGFRPGVAERLGIGPDACRLCNPHLVYGRITGWGREGPLALTAGHDIDYLAVAGALHPLGPPDLPPPPPLNMVADFGGGGLLLAFGVLAALVERERSGQGQVVDAAMIDGAALQTILAHQMKAAGLWSDRRGDNLLDGGAPFYDVYETADGRYLAVGALEPRFFSALIRGLGLDEDALPPQYDREHWPELRAALAEAIAGRTRGEWAEVFADGDACAAPVLSLEEAPRHPHNRSRATFLERDGAPQPAPAPRFDRTPPQRPRPAPPVGGQTDDILASAGFTTADIAALRQRGVVF